MELTPKRRKCYHRLVRDFLRSREDRLARRQQLQACIAEHAENGRVALVSGGIDCDGGRWDNRVSLVTATVVAVELWIEKYHEYAEGPQWQTVEKPSVAADLTEDCRDLALEAFEDGRAHVLYA
jgi:hypothetical protein